MRWCEQGVAKPRFGSPRVTERGVDAGRHSSPTPRQPRTSALIARHGGDWFRQVGTDDRSGNRTGHGQRRDRRTGVYEIEARTER